MVRAMLAGAVGRMQSAGAAKALTVSVDMVDCGLTTIETSYNESPGLLEAQPWWGNNELAEDFAAAVGDGLGDVDGIGFGHNFSARIATSPSGQQRVNGAIYFISGDSVFGLSTPLGSEQTYAIVDTSVVSVPPATDLMLTGLAGLWRLRRRSPQRGRQPRQQQTGW